MLAVAIDGPAGAGKSTIARRAAAEIGFIYVDTGALYRAVGLAVLRRGIDPSDNASIRSVLGSISVSFVFFGGEQHVLLCGEDVTSEIRSAEVSMVASRVSAIPEVREFLFSLQKDFAKNNDVVMDGRDIGTVVLPDAQVKIFLTASPEERARRRYEETLEKGQRSVYEEVLRDIRQRDENDRNRKTAPLVPAEDAIMVDTTGNTLERSVHQLVSIIKERLNEKNK